MDELQSKFCQKKLKVLEKQRSEYENALKETETQLEEFKQRCALLETGTGNDNKKLTNEEIARYSRQIILPGFGVQGQIKLKGSSVLIVGAGGLGCPSAQHLAGTGIGHIGIVDYDIVEINNLHRQLLHTEDSIGTPKVESLKRAITSLNSNVEVSTFHTQLTSTNCFDILKNFDIILDCTDNVATRYLLNDACVMLRKPLVSGSALQYEGQLTVYNYNNGPCYRCLFPIPPNPESVTNCSDSGVVATVTGVIGTMQAMEALKIIQNMNGILYGKLLIYDALEATFRNVKLRTRKIECMVCGESPTIKELIDYEEFCGMKANDKDMHLNILEENDRIAVGDYKKYYLDRKEKKHILIDVRNINEFEICQLPGSLNIPMKELLDDRKSSEILKKLKYDTNQSQIDIFTVCRRGNDSQLAVNRLKSLLPNANIKDLIGGLHAWTKTIDSSFPIY